MSESIYAGSTSQTVDIFIQDSSSTTGAGLSGLVFNSAGLVASYRKGATGSRTAITLATQTVGGAYSSGGFVEIEATHMKGLYRFDIPNAAIDANGFAALYFYGATNMLATPLRVDCRAMPADVKKWLATAVSTPTVAGVPNVNAKTWNDLTTVDLPATPTNITAATGIVLSGVTHTGAVIPTVATLAGHTPQTGDTFTLIGTAGAGLTAIGDTRLANLDATVSSRLSIVGYTTPPNAASVATAVLTTQMTESYAADGTAPTLTQAMMLALQNVGEVSISGVTKTVKKLDGTTTAATYTLDSATDPTSSTRAT